MTRKEIANVIRDFSLDVQAALNDEFGDNKISTELRLFADRVENDEEDEPPAPVTDPSAVDLVKKIVGTPGTYDYMHGEER